MNVLFRVRKVFSECGLKQKDIAEKLDLSQPYISKLMKDDSAKPSEMCLKAICNYFNISYEWLTTGEGEMKSEISTAKEILRPLFPNNEFAVNALATAADMPLEWWLMFEKVVKDFSEKYKEKNW